jgi:ubiquinone/menaquinone biosynthesis C-methylase UbiE
MSFNPVAPWYGTLEWIVFGNALQRCRTACLDQLARPKRVLIVGEGNGRFLCELLQCHPQSEVDCVDSSKRMLRLAQQRLTRTLNGHAGGVRWLCQDVTKWSPPKAHYDLVVTHFLLDCFDEAALAGVVDKLARACTNDAIWLLADFSRPADGIARLHAIALVWLMYRFFRLTARIEATELIDPAPLIEREGFGLVRQHLSRKGLLKSEIWRPSAAACDRN